jgi:hypothetical protein
MHIEKAVLKGRLYGGGNERLRYTIEVPRLENAEKINTFYQKMAEECELFCKGKLFEGLRASASKHWRYELTFRVTHNDGEVLSLVFVARLRREGDTIAERAFANTWSISDRQMMPPNIILKRFCGKKERKKFRGEVFLENGTPKEMEKLAFCQKV